MLNGTAGRDGDCSFGWLCRRAGGRLPRGEMTTTTMTTDNGDRCGITPEHCDNDDVSAEERQQMGEILEDLSEEDADLLGRTLDESSRACIEGEVLTI
jgi:hypothetical protein